MSDENTEILKEISRKFDQLIALWKLNNREDLEKFKKEIKKDKGFSKILEYCDGTLSYSDLSNKVAEEAKIAPITAKQKISALKNMGVLIPKRRGREVYYETSGLLD